MNGRTGDLFHPLTYFYPVNQRSIAPLEYGTRILGISRICAAVLRALAQARPHIPFYFWLNPKVTKDQEPIKGDFSFAKPRSLLPLHAFIAGLTNSTFLLLLCIIELSDHFISSAIPTIAIPLVAPHITGDGFDTLS